MIQQPHGRHTGDLESDQDDPPVVPPVSAPVAECPEPVDSQAPFDVAEELAWQPSRRSRVRFTPVIAFAGDLVATAVALLIFDADPADAVLATVATMLALGIQRAYRRKLALSVLNDLPKLILAAAAGVFVVGALLHRHAAPLPAARLTVTVVIAIIAGRIISYAIIRWLRRRGTLAARTLVIGGGVIGARLTQNALEHRGLGLRPIGIVDANPVPEAQRLNVRLVSPDLPLSGVITTLRVDTVVVAFSEARETELLDTLRTCDRLDCELLVVPRLFELASLTDDMQLVRDIPLTRVRRAPYRTVQWRFKRVFDIAFSAVALLLLSPLLAVVALAVWLTDRTAAVLFRQSRIGLDGVTFVVVKFRTMRPAGERDSATTWSIAHDPRVGHVGRFLRRTSLDELPQFWNVLVGDMSIVGPRPERPYFAAEFDEAMRHYGARHRVPAGLTGWAAVHGLRGNTSVRERAAYDNYYIENWSLWFDLKIIALTVLAVLRGSGG